MALFCASGAHVYFFDAVNHACEIVFHEEFGKAGDRVIITAGVPFGTPGATNMLRIAYIGPDGKSGI